jgi:hypothetical protein
MLLHRFLIGLPALLLLLATSQVNAGIFGHGCGHAGCAACCAPQICYVEKTVMQPTWCIERQKVVCTETRTVMQEKKYVVNQCVPVQTAVPCMVTVMEPQVRVKQVPVQVCKPVVRQVTREYHVCVPKWVEREVQYTENVPVWVDREVSCTVMVQHQEMRQGVNRVCKMVAKPIVKQVQRDCGHWATQTYTVQCGSYVDCNGCCHPVMRTCCRRVWVPKIVVENVTCTVYEPSYVDVPYNYCVTVCKPEVRKSIVRECSYRQVVRTCKVRECCYVQEMRQCTFNVTEYKPEVEYREARYTVCVPKEVQTTKYVTSYKTVQVEKSCMVPVCVPQQVEKEICVRVCKMVPKTITVPVCCGPCCK